LAYTLIGSFYLWKKDDEKWIEDFFLTGHFKPVKDLDWSSCNKHLLTGSHD
jgi:hypothetical protein